MKRWILVLALVSACSAPVTIVTPQGKISYAADQIVIRVNELQNAAIAANATTPPSVTTAVTGVIVRFCVSADATLAATPAGWQASLLTAWTTAKSSIPTQTNPAIIAAMAAVDVALGVTQ